MRASDLPPGYVPFRCEDGRLLALPVAAADEETAARKRKLMDAAAEQRRAAEAEEAANSAEEETAQPSESDGVDATAWPPKPGFHRVLPRFEELFGPAAAASSTIASPDTDVQKRQEDVRKRLLALGPDRRINRAQDWPRLLDEVEQALPNFARPIELLRDALTLADAAGRGTRIPPMLLLGPPGIGKTYFSHRVAEVLDTPHATIAFDQPTAGTQLRGSDKYWSNTEAGLLFKLLCLGNAANPLILLDEIDKASGRDDRYSRDPLAQLLGALEPESARCLQDISTDIEFDASLVGYIATANSLQGLSMPLLSRFAVFDIGPPTRHEAVQVARQVIDAVLLRLGLKDAVRFEPRCAYVLAHLSPRLMQRSVELLAAAALRDKRDVVRENDAWQALGDGEPGPRLH